MTVADLLYVGAPVSGVLFSGVLLLRQFSDGDLTERKRSGRGRRTHAPLVLRGRQRTALSWPTRGIIAVASSHAHFVGAMSSEPRGVPA